MLFELSDGVSGSYNHPEGVAAANLEDLHESATWTRLLNSSSFFSHSCALLHSAKSQRICFQAIPHSLRKTPGGGATTVSFRKSSKPRLGYTLPPEEPHCSKSPRVFCSSSARFF